MGKPEFITGPNGQPVAVEYRSRKSYEKKLGRQERKIEKQAIRIAETVGALAAAKAQIRNLSEGPPSAPTAPPPTPAPPPAPPSKRDEYLALREKNPWLAAQMLLNDTECAIYPRPQP
jgi:hypothetical protein